MQAIDVGKKYTVIIDNNKKADVLRNSWIIFPLKKVQNQPNELRKQLVKYILYILLIELN